MSEQTILASDFRVIVRYLSARGINADSALDAAGVLPMALSQPRARVPAQQLGELLTQLSHQFPESNLGFELADHHHVTDPHMLGITAVASATGIDALRRIIRYQALVSTHESLRLVESESTVTLSKSVVQNEAAEHIIQVFLFTVVLNAIRNITGFKGDIAGVRFTGRAQGKESLYRAHFGPRAAFSQSEAELILPRPVLEPPITTANVDILTANEPMLASLVRSVREKSLAATVKLAILDRLPERTLTEQEAADSQNISLRTFQRRLESENSRYRVLMDQTRTELAERLLADSNYALSEVSYYCGFSEQASFSRAFKRWTGQTPSRYREGLLASPA
ncbi:MAG: AraC family transcriptional regulator ligand-binding domain-containing protein [Luminiphilus sp.]|nr:AraC family transcriptional regulator ligand-binding domain-containing protein [Luminiphilus sp.]